MRGREIPGPGPIVSRFCSDLSLSRDNSPNSGPNGPPRGHITNVREGGTIPQFEQPWWQSLNTFRTNSQIEGGEVCQPIPQ